MKSGVCILNMVTGPSLMLALHLTCCASAQHRQTCFKACKAAVPFPSRAANHSLPPVWSWHVSGRVDVFPLKAKHAQDDGYPDINIIAEKVAAEGQTRFEDRYRLPIGISVNMTSYSGKLLTAALYNPRLIMVYAQARVAPCALVRNHTDHTQGTCRFPCISHEDKLHT
jgi:hypothetical protein